MRIEIAKDLEQALKALAQETHQSVEECAQDLIAEALEDRLDYMEAVAAQEENKKAGGKNIPFDQLREELGLDD
jgi:predicted DNA-binding protein